MRLVYLVFLQYAAASHGAVTADEAMHNYQAMVTSIVKEQIDCPKQDNQDIVVCGRRRGPSPRLPLPDERGEMGDAGRHASEAPSGVAAISPPPRAPSRLMETAGKVVNALKGVVTGEDTVD